MNKEITMFELYEQINNGNIPKKVKYCNRVYTFYEDDCQYYDKDYNVLNVDVSGDLDVKEFTNLKIIIILDEENDEFKDIEELNIENEGNNYFIRNEYGTKCGLTKHSIIIANKVNELIRNQKKIMRKLDKDE